MVGQLRDRDAIDLARLRAWADEWDHEAGACWPASRFVEWVELSLTTDHETRGADTRAAGQRRWRG